MDVDDQQQHAATRARPSRAPVGPRRQKLSSSSPGEPPAQYADAAVQVSSTPPKSTPTTTFVAPPPLAPPPAISFDSNPIPWKGLPLDAAQWTFSSTELQEIVSKAIRLSARESFVRLLSLQALEVDIVHESDRLETARLAAQAKWRFEVGRRTMLMHALNACASFSAAGPASEQLEGGNPIVAFVGQLATAIASCDSLLSTILQIADHQSQIAIIQHQHWASALGIALRKLNKAHERQAQELKRAQARVQTLEDELEEAWREAEKMAIEFDDFEEDIEESASEHTSEGLDAPLERDPDDADARPDQEPKHDLDETGTLGDMTIHTDIGVVLGVTATAVASKATLVTSPKLVDKSDTKSIRSIKSTRSRRSTRDGPSHFSRLSSARTRSRTASNASLRLPKALRSTSSTHTPPADAPPLPALPPSTIPGDSFLEMDNEVVRKVPPRHPEPTLSLPTPPHSAGLPPTAVPSIWLEPDTGQPTRYSSLDRTQSLQLFSSLTPRKMRRSNLVMSLTRSDRVSDGDGSRSGSGSGSGSASGSEIGIGPAVATGTRTASPTSNHSPVSLPTHALNRFRGPSLSLSSHSTPPGVGTGVGTGIGSGDVAGSETPRPGSAGARLTTTREEKETRKALGMRTASSPRRSLMSRASSVILRRLSQATIGGGTAGGKPVPGSPAKSREGSRLSGVVERWRDRGKEGEEGDVSANGIACGEDGEEGEVMLIGSLHADVFDTT